MSFDQVRTIRPAREELAAQQAAGASALRAAAGAQWDVLIIGAGLTGASGALHLVESARPPRSLLVVDHGAPGAGSRDRYAAPPTLPEGPKGEDIGEESVYHPGARARASAGGGGGALSATLSLAPPRRQLWRRHLLEAALLERPELPQVHRATVPVDDAGLHLAPRAVGRAELPAAR